MQAAPAQGVTSRLDWSRLVAVGSTETLAEEAVDDGSLRPTCVEINSGGQVFFGLLSSPTSPGQEEAVVMKFCNSRHLLQSEQMAAELAWHLEIAAPSSRLLLKAQHVHGLGEADDRG